MKCPKCQFENPDGAKFCNECGHKLEPVCPECGKANPPGSKFCNTCGRDLCEISGALPIDYSKPRSYTPKFLADKILNTRGSIVGERKLVTVLFADVANFTSMSERIDPEEVHQIMDGCFRILMAEVHRYEGTINQFTGDGVMALFGAPLAHEDHAQRACRAALAILRAVADYGEKIKTAYKVNFEMRLGLNSGTVIVGSIGDDLRMDYTALGDATNLAARMESLARPGSALVSKNIYQMAREFFQFKPLGTVAVKGKTEPQEVYELIEVSEIETRLEASVARGLTRFIGRERETGTLREIFEKARAGSGQVVGVVAEAGVGKSRLLLEMKRHLQDEVLLYLEGRCLPYGAGMVYLPILDILRAYFGFKEGDPVADIQKKLAEKISGPGEKLTNVIAPLQSLLSIPVEDKVFASLEPHQKKEKTFEALRNLFISISQDQPLIFALEDLHWIDRSSEAFLDYFIGWLANSHVMLLLTYRPEYDHKWGSRSYYTKIGLEHLPGEACRELIRSILKDGQVAPELEEFILNKASGNPLFVEEVTRSLLEEGSLRRRDGGYVLKKNSADIKVPATIQGIIAARLDHLEDHIKRTVQAASVIGRGFAFRILQVITEMHDELKTYLLHLQEVELIYEKSLLPELEYLFKHAITQEVAYESLLIQRRKELHEKTAKAIEMLYKDHLEEFYELLAYHYSRSDCRYEAVNYLDLANQKASSVHSLEEAKGYLDEALSILDELPDSNINHRRRISMLVNNVVVYQLLLAVPEYYDLLQRCQPVAEELEDSGLLGTFYARMGHVEWSFGEFDRSIATLTKAARLSEASGGYDDAAHAYVMMQWDHLGKGDFDKVVDLRKEVLRMAQQRVSTRWHVMTFCTVSLAYAYLGRWKEAINEGREALNMAEERSDDSMLSFAGWVNSVVHNKRGDPGQALQYAQMAVEKAPTPGDKAFSQSYLAWALCRSGETEKGIEMLSFLTPMMRSASLIPGEVENMVYLGEGYLLAGQQDQARQTLEEAAQMAEAKGFRYNLAWIKRMLGEIAIKCDPDNAAFFFDTSIDIFREIKAENQLALAYAGYGQFFQHQGSKSEAREYMNKALAIFERLGTLNEVEKVRKALACL